MDEKNYVTKEYCMKHMQEIEEKFDHRLDGVNQKASDMAAQFARLEATVNSIKGTLNLVLTAVVGGIGSVLVVLLTRGI